MPLEKLRAEHPEPPRPPAPGRVDWRLLLPAITAAEVLRSTAGIEVPITEQEGDRAKAINAPRKSPGKTACNLELAGVA